MLSDEDEILATECIMASTGVMRCVAKLAIADLMHNQFSIVRTRELNDLQEDRESLVDLRIQVHSHIE